MPPGRDPSSGRFVSGGGGGGGGGNQAGGVYAAVELDTSQINPALAKLNQATQQSSVALSRIGVASADAGKGMTKFGANALIAGQFLDDLQYGLRAVVNQIPQAVGAFGGSAGLAGVIGIVAVAVNQLVMHWDKLTGLFTNRGPETASQEMKRLAENTGRTADEQKRLNELKQQEKNIETQKNRPTEAQKQNQQEVAGAVTEAPRSELAKDVESVLMQRGKTAVDEAVRARISNELGFFPLRQKSRRAVESRIRQEEEEKYRDEVQKRADQIIERAEFGTPEDRKTLEDMAAQNPNMPGFRGLRSQLGVPRIPSDVGQDAVERFRKTQAEDLANRATASETGQDAVERFRKTQAEDLATRGMMAETGQEAADKWKKRRDDEEKDLREADIAGRKLLKDRRREMIEDKIDREEGITQEEFNALPDDRQRGLRSKSKSLDEGMNDLLYQRYQLMNPEKQGQTMGLDQYEASIKAKTGETTEAKRLKELVDINKKILDVQNKRRGLMVRQG